MNAFGVVKDFWVCKPCRTITSLYVQLIICGVRTVFYEIKEDLWHRKLGQWLYINMRPEFLFRAMNTFQIDPKFVRRSEKAEKADRNTGEYTS